MSLRWEDADYAFPAAGLDCFLMWVAERGASDVSFQTGAPAFIEIDGILCRATRAVLDGVAIGRLVAKILAQLVNRMRHLVTAAARQARSLAPGARPTRWNQLR